MPTTPTIFLSKVTPERALLEELITQLDGIALNSKDDWTGIETSALYLGGGAAISDALLDEYQRADIAFVDRYLLINSNTTLPENAAIDPADVLWYTDIDDLRHQAEQALKGWQAEKQAYHPGALEAILATDPTNIPYQPSQFTGRAEDLAQIRAALAQKRRIVLHGLGGMGKTALAATAATEFLHDQRGPVLWLKIGHESVNAVFEALARPFDAILSITSKHGEAKSQAVRTLLTEQGIQLLVLDHALDGPTLKQVLGAVPDEIPVIVTARRSYPLDVRIRVDALLALDAIALLTIYTGNPTIVDDPTAAELCQWLGHNPFGIRLAGQQMAADQLTPAQLLERLQNVPHKLAMPLEFGHAGQSALGDLLESCVWALEKDPRYYFRLFGVFFAPQITSRLLMCYVAPTPKLETEWIAGMRAKNPAFADMSDDKLAEWVLMQTLDRVDTASIDRTLDILVARGLVERIEATADQVTSYVMPDLIYAYLKTHAKLKDQAQVLLACEKYCAIYRDNTPKIHALLRPLLPQLIGAVRWADVQQDNGAIEQIAYDLAKNSGFLDTRDYYAQTIELLSRAAVAGQRSGLAIDDKPNIEKAVVFYKLLFDANHRMKDDYEEALTADVLSQGYSALGYHKDAAYSAIFAIVDNIKMGDQEQTGRAYSQLGDVWTLSGDTTRSISALQRALKIARKSGDRLNEATTLGRLGHAFASSGEFQRSIAAYDEALPIIQELGDRNGEASALTNLGSAYLSLGNHSTALAYYQQARAIFVELDNQTMLEFVDEQIATIQPASVHHPKPRKGWFRR